MGPAKKTISNHYWDEVFTVDNIIEYGRAAKELAYYLRVLFSEGYDSIVIPSRGVMPIFRAAKHAWFHETSTLQTLEERFDSKIEILGSPLHAVTLLPFSADPDEKTQTSKGIRSFWVKVLSALVRRDGKDPHLVFYQKIIEHLQLKELTSVLPRNLPSSKFIFIDTVVSGRAIDEILDAFEAEGLDKCHLILLIDDNGNRIEKVYKKRIEALEAEGRCTRINLKSLWTEDRGPSVSGVWSTVYPQVLKKLHGRYTWSKDIYGAGSFYHKVSSSQVTISEGIGGPDYNMPITILHGSVSTMIFTVISTLQQIESLSIFSKTFTAQKTHDLQDVSDAPATSVNFEEKLLSRMRETLEFSLSMLKDDLNDMIQLSPLEKETTVKLAQPRVTELFKTAQVTASSSHLVRVDLPQNKIDALFSDFDQSMQNPSHDALAYSWFSPTNDWAQETQKFLQRRAADREANEKIASRPETDC